MDLYKIEIKKTKSQNFCFDFSQCSRCLGCVRGECVTDGAFVKTAVSIFSFVTTVTTAHHQHNNRCLFGIRKASETFRRFAF